MLILILNNNNSSFGYNNNFLESAVSVFTINKSTFKLGIVYGISFFYELIKYNSLFYIPKNNNSFVRSSHSYMLIVWVRIYDQNRVLKFEWRCFRIQNSKDIILLTVIHVNAIDAVFIFVPLFSFIILAKRNINKFASARPICN